MGHMSDSVLLALLVTLSANYTFAKNIIRQTTAGDSYELAPFVLSDVKYIEFEVKACQDAKVLLATDPVDESSGVFEIVIGLNGERSEVRPGIGLPAVEVDPPIFMGITHNPLDCNQLLRFWVSWQYGVCVGTGPYNDAHDGEFLYYPQSSPSINYYKIATGPGSNGEWVLGASCGIHGDPHTESFDSKKYTFNGICVYDLVDYVNNFEIEADYDKCRHGKSCLASVLVKYGNRKIYFQGPNMMKEGNILNNPTALPYSSTSGGLGLKVSEIVNPTSKYVYQIQLHNGVNVLWDGDKSVEIELPLALNDVIYGMCGTYTQNPDDDLTLRDRTTLTTDLDVFGDSWKATPTCRCAGGWHWFKDYCYSRNNNVMNYAAAKAQCENSYRGFLVHVVDNATDQFLKETFDLTTFHYWLGSTYHSNKGKFVWDQSESLPGTNVEPFGWLNGVPSDGASQGCVHYNANNGNIGWENVDCGLSLPYLCMRAD